MAQHVVRFSIPERNLGKSDIEFKVWSDGELFGTLEISKGSLVWYPKGTQYGYKRGWGKFNGWMLESNRYEKR